MYKKTKRIHGHSGGLGIKNILGFRISKYIPSSLLFRMIEHSLSFSIGEKLVYPNYLSFVTGRELILYLLHVSGAQRCTAEVKGCLPGCALDGSHNGVPDKAMLTLMKLDSVGG